MKYPAATTSLLVTTLVSVVASRHSVNHGAHLPHRVFHHDPATSPFLAAFQHDFDAHNATMSSIAMAKSAAAGGWRDVSDDDTARALAIAHAFVTSLHPNTKF